MKRIWAWLWTRNRKWRGLMAIALGFFLIGSIISIEVTSQPHFCGSCHIMKPYYESWQTSSHSDVSCVKCHIEPGMDSYMHAKLNGLGQVVDDVLNRTGFKPSASVASFSCTRSGCHSIETLSGKTIDNGVFKFRHDKHIGKSHLGIEISCGTCHSHVLGDEHFEVNTSVCITCHLVESEINGYAHSATSQAEIRLVVRAGHTPEPDDNPRPPSTCTTCHVPPADVFEYQGLTIDHDEFLSHGASCESCHRHATAPPPPIEDGRCVTCHTFGVEQSLPVEEMHEVHAHGKHKIECFSCHGLMQHGITAQAMSLEQFDCRRCHIDQHSAQRDAYLVTSITNGKASEHGIVASGDAINPMFLAHVDCTGCHVRSIASSESPMSRAQIRTASAESCDGCHEPGLGDKMIPLWQTATRRLYDKATEQLEAIIDAGIPEKHADKVNQARQLLDLVRLDGSWGVHNPTYTEELLQSSLEFLLAAKEGQPEDQTSDQAIIEGASD